MAIERVKIKDFLIFKGELNLDFSPGINVIIGANATGKSTLLKNLYRYANAVAGKGQWYKETCEITATTKQLAEVFDKPEKRGISTGAAGSVFDVNLDKKIITGVVYIPEKDLLSNSKGLPETAEFGKLQFTDYEIDIIKKARVAPNKPKQELVKTIEKIIGGEVLNDGESFFVKKTDMEIPVPFSMEASGFKKFALLAVLIRNEQISPGTVLFWDEPENSLNPELIPQMVEILFRLQREDVQIFLATHSEVLARYFNVNSNKSDRVQFYSLHTNDTGTITADVNKQFDRLIPNTLAAEPVRLYEKEIEKAFANG
ncbi:MAG: AAA family ATPase [Treponema sp.]|jgi:predicted ATPase|nr:AAA family ATPase [Treponema sp.]